MKVEPLRKRKDFQNVFQRGKKFFSSSMTGRSAPSERAVVRLGIIVGTKTIKKAVIRNRVRRRTREALRVLLKETPQARGMDVVLLPKTSALETPFAALKQELAKIFIGTAQNASRKTQRHADDVR